MLEVATAASVAGVARQVYKHNRDAWMTNTDRKAGRHNEAHNLMMQEAGIMRDDIKHLCDAAMVRQRNYVALATMFLGMTGTCYVKEPLPTRAAQFLAVAYRQCVGSAFFYLVLAVLYGMAAIHMVTRCQRDMLLTRVRLPVHDIAKSLKASAFSESIEAFEHQGARTILRVPGASYFRTLAFGGPCPKRSKTGRKHISVVAMAQQQERQEEALDNMASPHHEAAFAVDALRNMEERQAQHLEVFYIHEREWILCGQQAILLAALGMGHLLEAYGLISIAQYYAGDVWTSWTVEAKVTIGNLVTSAACGRYLDFSWKVLLFESMFVLAGPMACTRAVLPYGARGFYVSMMFFCRTVINAIALYKLYWMSPAGGSGPPPRANFCQAGTSEPEEEVPSSSDEKLHSSVNFRRRRCQTEQLPGSSANTLTLVAGSSIVSMSWMLCFLWAEYHRWECTTASLLHPRHA